MKKLTISRIIGIILNVILLILNFKPWIELQWTILTFTKWNRFKDSISYYSGSRDWGMYDLLSVLAWIIVICVVISILYEICGNCPDVAVPVMSFFLLIGEIVLISVGKNMTTGVDGYMGWRPSTITSVFWGVIVITILLIFSVPERIGKAIGNSISIEATTITNTCKTFFDKTSDMFSEDDTYDQKPEKFTDEEETVILQNMYYNGGPLIIKKVVLVRINDKYYAKNIFKNISDKQINAVQVNIIGTDPFGTITDTIENYAYLDLEVNIRESFGEKIYIPLPSGKSRDISITVNGVLFEDKKLWEREGEPLIQYVQKTGTFELDDYSDDLLGMQSAKQMVDYLQKLEIDDSMLLNIIEELQNIVNQEKFYGNMPELARTTIKGYLER